MSTAMAIAATSRVLSAVIDQRITGANLDAVVGGAPHVTSKPPDRLESENTEKSQLGLFLYRVSHNQGWREVGLPSRNGAGDAVDRPPLALNLHFLLTAYGPDDYGPQMLLGLGIQALHENPVLYRQQIRGVFTPPLGAVDKALATARLDEQIELIKVTPEPLTTDDLSKLWTAFGGRFRPCVGFEASVVLIEGETPVRPSLPVLTRTLAVIQFLEPAIATVAPQFLPWADSLTVTLVGANLSGEGVVVVFDGNPAAPQPPQKLDAAGSRVTATVPPLQAGINTLRVVRRLDIGTPPGRNVVESNVSLFYLQPLIRRDPDPPHADLVEPGLPTPLGRPVTVTLDPMLNPGQRVQLRLNETAPPAGETPRGYTFDAAAVTAASNTVTFTTFGTRAGPHLVRVAVDGAESPLRSDPTLGFTGPLVLL